MEKRKLNKVIYQCSAAKFFGVENGRLQKQVEDISNEIEAKYKHHNKSQARRMIASRYTVIKQNNG